MATLKHNDNISAFYGVDALKNAHNSAVNGDIITLSPGSFNAVNITKAVTIRGAGMFIDTVAGTNPTHINGNFSISIPNDSIYHLTLEGLYIPHTIYAINSYKTNIIKCMINKYERTSNVTVYNVHGDNTTIINCIIESLSTDKMVNTQVLNSVILSFGSSNAEYSTIFSNCVVRICSTTNHSFFNSILYCNSTGYSTYNAFNCIGIFTVTYTNGNYFLSPLLNGCKNYSSLSAVFKDFDGTYINGETTFELQDSIANTMLGQDGTQVGIYGGYMPFDARVSNPLIRKINVANRSTADGKLSVDIEVVSE
ncbi:MAG: hypothetical protein IJ748_04095 [Bacteroidales bacterium]|nr:hypothetical protein [Bacteroidales bacterium]